MLEDEAKSEDVSKLTSPHTHQPPQKHKDKGRKVEAAIKGAIQSKGERLVLGLEDERLAKAIDMIDADTNEDLIRGLLFVVAQHIPEARTMVLKA